MRKLPEKHPEIYKEFMEGKFVVKTKNGNFNAVSPEARTDYPKSKKE